MTIPSYEALMLPMLKLLSNGSQRSMSELRNSLAEQLGITASELAEMLPSGQQTVFHSRVGWARTYLKKARLVDSPSKGQAIITVRGQAVLKGSPSLLDNEYLSQFPEFVEFKTHKPKSVSVSGSNGGVLVVTALHTAVPPIPALTPEESLQRAHQVIMDTVSEDLLARVRQCSPAFFERLVVQLLVRMGYGGSEKDAAQAVGKSGDGGIDGVIREDPLGLDFVYIQAKRWDGTVGSPQIHQFVGALQGKGARKGVFITTSTFTKDARQFSVAIPTPRLVLIDGAQLADLMIRYGVGVSTAETYVIKRVDSDFFAEE
jgi:restriction system protein